jgi:hypothetical protein
LLPSSMAVLGGGALPRKNSSSFPCVESMHHVSSHQCKQSEKKEVLCRLVGSGAVVLCFAGCQAASCKVYVNCTPHKRKMHTLW